MKKFFLVALLLCSSMLGFAQSRGDLRIGVTGGMNVSKITHLENIGARAGFTLGARVDYGFTDHIYMNGGLVFSQKGYKETEKEEGVKVTVKGNPCYLQIPINVGYTYHLGKHLGVFGETGPYFAFGIGGKNKIKSSGDDTKVEVKDSFFGDDGAHVFDAGWGVRVGVEVFSFQVHLGYEYGIAKVNASNWDMSEAKGNNHNSTFNIGLTYIF